jgi:hypothetical protein
MVSPLEQSFDLGYVYKKWARHGPSTYVICVGE